MKILTLEVGKMQNLTYIISFNNSYIIIDPSFGYDTIKRYISCDKEIFVLITHGHYDHVMDCNKLVDYCSSVKIYLHSADKFLVPFNLTEFVDVSKINNIDVEDEKIEVIKTPGHSPGSVCYKISNHLFTGDTLFFDCCGRVDLPGSDPKQLRESLLKIYNLDDETIIHPGHDYGGKEIILKEAKKINPFLYSLPDAKLFFSMIL
ncbi:MAG: MBL fold metallo-hydrolase [Elusimicrobiales bacterium]|nr:MBL fold metallo-hydrolase [Elusimicrobiales bacterium]